MNPINHPLWFPLRESPASFHFSFPASLAPIASCSCAFRPAARGRVGPSLRPGGAALREVPWLRFRASRSWCSGHPAGTSAFQRDEKGSGSSGSSGLERFERRAGPKTKGTFEGKGSQVLGTPAHCGKDSATKANWEVIACIWTACEGISGVLFHLRLLGESEVGHPKRCSLSRK